MRTRRRSWGWTTTCLVLWGVGSFAPFESARAVAAGAAVVVLPGAFIVRLLLPSTPAYLLCLPALAVTASVGFIGLLGAGAWMLGASLAELVLVLAVATLGAAVLVDRAGAPPPDAGTSLRLCSDERALLAAIGIVVAAATVLAAVDVNIARDRMWYAAWIQRLAVADAIDWRDPMLGSTQISWRFAANAWLVSLAAWKEAAATSAPFLLERAAPPFLLGFVASAAFVLSSAFWPRRRAMWAVLCTLAVFATTSWPYFSPERYAFFARLAEDKTFAVVVLAPTAIGCAIRILSGASPCSRSAWSFCALALVAVALTHAIVYAVVLASIAAAAIGAWIERSRFRRALAALTLAATVAVVPATFGLRARAAMPAHALPQADDADTRTHPIVRAHLRLDRLLALEHGGPIVHPRLILQEPLLIIALLGLASAWRARTRLWGVYLLGTSGVGLAAAFTPWVAPAIGRLLVPWMAYRTLWTIPFGILLTALLQPVEYRRRAALALVAGLTAACLAGLPWQRIQTSRPSRLEPSETTRALLARIARLPNGSMIAAAPSLSELVPAYSGHPVLAVADRPMLALLLDRREAEERMRENTVIVALSNVRPALALALARRRGVTHLVLPSATSCPPGTRTAFAAAPHRLCAIPANVPRADLEPAVANLDEARRATRVVERWPLAAALTSADLVCDPAPAGDSVRRWKRATRWSAEPVRVVCRTRLDASSARIGLIVEPALPRARDALVYLIVGKDRSGARRCDQIGAVEIAGRTPSALAFDCAGARELEIHLAAAYLPYISVRDVRVLVAPATERGSQALAATGAG